MACTDADIQSFWTLQWHFSGWYSIWEWIISKKIKNIKT